MNISKTLFFALLAGVLAITAFAQTPQPLKRTITKTDRFDFGAGGTVSITGAPNGSIRVTSTAKNEIEITAEIELQAASEAELNQLAAVTGFVTEESVARTGIVSVGTNNRLGDKKQWKKFPKDLIGLPFRIDYVISVPRYCDLEINGGKGDLSVVGVDGSMRIDFLETNARIETGGKRMGNKGFFYEPTVMTEVPLDARIMNEEPFGPLAPIMPFSDYDSVVKEANRLPYGLAAYAYTRSAKTAAKLGEAIESGMVSINHHGLALPETPFGGIKDSGYGSEGGSEAIESYLNTKFITHQTGF